MQSQSLPYVVFVHLEAAEEFSLDSPLTKEANDVNHHKDDVLSGALAEPVDSHSHDSSSEPPKLSVSESAVSPPIPKSQSVPEVSPAAKPRSDAKVDGTCCCYSFPVSLSYVS